VNKNFKLETIKAKYQIVKDKILLFGAGFGGSVMILLEFDFNSEIAIIFFSIGVLTTILGLLKNLYLAGKLYNDIEKVENE